MFDLTVYPLSFAAGRELYELPGLLVMAAPRKAARMRGQDQLIISMKLITVGGASGGPAARFSPSQQAEMLNRLGETYFSFPGSVTAGLRAVTTRLNEFLLARNLKATHEGQTVGMLNIAVLHGSSLIVAHAGPTHTFVLGKAQVQHFDDSLPSGGAGRGLGLSKLAVPRFYQATAAAQDLLIFCAEPPSTWTPRSLASSPQLPFEHLRRRLISDSSGDLQAAVVRLTPGKGQVTTWRPGDRSAAETERPAPIPPAAPAAATTAPSAPAANPNAPVPPPMEEILTAYPDPEPEPDAAPPLDAPPQVDREPQVDLEPQSEQELQTYQPPRFRRLPTPAEIESGSYKPEDLEPAAPPPPARPHIFVGSAADEAAGTVSTAAPQPSPRPARSAEMAGPSAAPRGRRTGEAAPQPARSTRQSAQPKAVAPPRENALGKSLSAAGGRVRAAWMRGAPGRARVRGAFSSTASKVIPKRYDPEGREVPLFNMSSGIMLSVAILVPLVVVAMATAVYFQAGRSEQFQAIFLQAQQYALAATQQSDPLMQRESWTRAYELVRQAEQYGSTEQSVTLRKQAQNALDNLESLWRLDYRPAGRGIPADVNITRIVATLNDVYLLDSNQGSILRLYRTATGYEVDASFTCGAGQVGSMVIDKLIDLAPMPTANEPGATVMGIDGSGNVVYCSPSMEGFKSRPLALPDLGWGKIAGIYMHGDRLYVLDPTGNAVYYYDGDRGVFDESPHFYFGDQIPRMGDVVDLTVDQEFLYLLHADGQMTVCEGGGYSLAPTNCQDTPYGDPRTGFEPSPLTFQGARFTQIQATQPPDPSLFALDETNRSIYHLSLRRLNLQRQYRPLVETDFPVPNGPVTAFAIAPNRRAIIAFGNRVFFAPLP